MSLDLSGDRIALLQVMAVPSGNKQFPDPILTQIYVSIWGHEVTMS